MKLNATSGCPLTHTPIAPGGFLSTPSLLIPFERHIYSKVRSSAASRLSSNFKLLRNRLLSLGLLSMEFQTLSLVVNVPVRFDLVIFLVSLSMKKLCCEFISLIQAIGMSVVAIWRRQRIREGELRWPFSVQYSNTISNPPLPATTDGLAIIRIRLTPLTYIRP